jgi:hypothetical protein
MRRSSSSKSSLILRLRLPSPQRLAIPAMSAEYERVFSSAKKLVIPERNCLREWIIEASECLKIWWDRELIVQQPHSKGMTPKMRIAG